MLLNAFERFLTKKVTYVRTNERTNGVTSSLFELLSAAKNNSFHSSLLAPHSITDGPLYWYLAWRSVILIMPTELLACPLWKELLACTMSTGLLASPLPTGLLAFPLLTGLLTCQLPTGLLVSPLQTRLLACLLPTDLSIVNRTAYCQQACLLPTELFIARWPFGLVACWPFIWLALQYRQQGSISNDSCTVILPDKEE